MIPVIITVIKNKLLNFINAVKQNSQTIAVIISMIFAAFLFIQHKELVATKSLLDKVQSNYEFYMNKSANVEQENRVLQLDIERYKETNDSLIFEIKTTKKK